MILFSGRYNKQTGWDEWSLGAVIWRICVVFVLHYSSSSLVSRRRGNDWCLAAGITASTKCCFCMHLLETFCSCCYSRSRNTRRLEYLQNTRRCSLVSTTGRKSIICRHPSLLETGRRMLFFQCATLSVKQMHSTQTSNNELPVCVDRRCVRACVRAWRGEEEDAWSTRPNPVCLNTHNPTHLAFTSIIGGLCFSYITFLLFLSFWQNSPASKFSTICISLP